MRRSKIKPEDLCEVIHADPGVRLKVNRGIAGFDPEDETLLSDVLELSGKGRCELGDVRSNVSISGDVFCVARKVYGEVDVSGDASFRAESVSGAVVAMDNASVEVVRCRRAVSWDASFVRVISAEQEGACWDEGRLIVGGRDVLPSDP
jgi:hypothetical protein